MTIRSRTLLLATLAVAAVASANVPAQAAPYVTYRNDKLEVLFLGSELKPKIDRYLNKVKSGEIHRTDTQWVTISNLRTTFKNGAISVRVNYKAGMRGWTWIPAPTFKNPKRKIKQFGPWATDTGWLEVDFRTQVKNWVLYVHTRNGYVRWKSRNKFTNFIGSAFDNKIRQSVADAVNSGIKDNLGGRAVDLKSKVVTYGAPIIARQLRLPTNRVQSALRNGLNRVNLDAKVTTDGIKAMISAPRNLFLTSTGNGGTNGNGGGGSSQPTGERRFSGLTSQQYQGIFDRYVKQGYRPITLRAYTRNGQARFDLAMRRSGGAPWQARHGLSTQQYQLMQRSLGSRGYRLTHHSTYTEHGRTKHLAMWVKSGRPRPRPF